MQGEPYQPRTQEGGAVDSRDPAERHTIGFQKIGDDQFIAINNHLLYIATGKKDKNRNPKPESHILVPLRGQWLQGRECVTNTEAETEKPDENENILIEKGKRRRKLSHVSWSVEGLCLLPIE